MHGVRGDYYNNGSSKSKNQDKMKRLLVIFLTILLASPIWSAAQPNYSKNSNSSIDSLRTAKLMLRRMLVLDSLKSAKLALCDAELAFTAMRYSEALDGAERAALNTLALADSLNSLRTRAEALNAEAVRLAEVNRWNVVRMGMAIARERKRRWLWIGLGAMGGLLLTHF